MKYCFAADKLAPNIRRLQRGLLPLAVELSRKKSFFVLFKTFWIIIDQQAVCYRSGWVGDKFAVKIQTRRGTAVQPSRINTAQRLHSFGQLAEVDLSSCGH